MIPQMDDDTRKAIEKIEKLMRLAGSNPNEAEAASALAKAQELLVAYNLDMAVIEQASGASGKRLSDLVAGGMHKYQRQLWRSIAELNFCLYWTQKNRVKEGSNAARRKRSWTHEHRIVGRQVNVIATKNMAFYLDKTIERLCRERLGVEAHKQYYSSWAIAFREGIADGVIEKIEDRRQGMLKAEEKAERAAAKKAAASGISTATALTISGLSQAEEDANQDFIHGEGWSAKKRAREAEWERDWDKRQKQRAEAQQRAEQAYAQWAAAHPEEAAKEAAQERARERARERRAERGGGWGRHRFRQTKEEMRKGSDAYQSGMKVSEKVSIDPQMDSGSQKRIGHG